MNAALGTGTAVPRLFMHKASQFTDSQRSGTRVLSLAAFLIPVIAKAMPEQTHHKHLVGGVRNIFMKPHRSLFALVQRYHFPGGLGKGQSATSVSTQQPQVCDYGI